MCRLLFFFLLSPVLRECGDGACDSVQSCPRRLTSWHRHRGWIGLDNICTNFMPIKVRLPKHARSLSHSYDYCLNGVGLWREKERLPALSNGCELWCRTPFWPFSLWVIRMAAKPWHWGWQSLVTLGLFGRNGFQTHGISFLKMVPTFPAPVHPLASLPSRYPPSPVLLLHYNWQARCYFFKLCSDEGIDRK